MPRLVTIDESTGAVLSEWIGGEDQTLSDPPAGQVRLTDPPAPADGVIVGKRWDGSAFVTIDPPPVRRLSRLAFARRFTFDEHVAIETAAATDAGIRAFLRLMDIAEDVGLDDDDLVAGLAYLKSVHVPWADDETADTRIAAIRA